MVDLQNNGACPQKAMLWIRRIDVQAKWLPAALKREWSESRTEGRALSPTRSSPRVLNMDELKVPATGKAGNKWGKCKAVINLDALIRVGPMTATDSNPRDFDPGPAHTGWAWVEQNRPPASCMWAWALISATPTWNARGWLAISLRR